MPRITKEIGEQVVKLYRTPKSDGSQRTQAEVGAALGYTHNFVYRVLKRNNALIGRWYRTKFPESVELEIINKYFAEQPDGRLTSAAEIAREYGANTTYIHNVIKKHGYKLRGISETLAHHPACKPIKNLPPAGELPPLCKCGCGNPTIWNQRKNGWNVYVEGHYLGPFKDREWIKKFNKGSAHTDPNSIDIPYKNKEWLQKEYAVNFRTSTDIANQFGVRNTAILYWLRKNGIPVRTQKESLKLSGNVRGSKNAAWKGGIAKWGYSHDWKSLCKEIKDRDNWTCRGCSERRSRWGNNLHVHHKDENKFNNSPDNLISLCSKCHAIAHSKNKHVLTCLSA